MAHSDRDRRQDRGAFWGSLHGTLCHLLWADRMWMSRFDGWEKPAGDPEGQRDTDRGFRRAAASAGPGRRKDFGLGRARHAGWLAEDQIWFSASAQKEMRQPRSFLVTHFFNHQTHHRGQAHALITACGEKTGDTDLFLVVPEAA